MANFDDIHMKFARKIFDPVATSATNGVKVTSALRTDYFGSVAFRSGQSPDPNVGFWWYYRGDGLCPLDFCGSQY